MNRNQSAIRPVAKNSAQSAFTLVELLVVITIIGILVALLIPAVMGALGAGKRTRIAGEVNGTAEAIEIFKNEVAGGAYPPDAFIGRVDSDTPTPNSTQGQVFSEFKRFFNKAFPKHHEADELIYALVGYGSGPQITGETAALSGGGLTPAEAAVFWRQRFSSDPRYPISGEGGPAFVVGLVEDLSARNWVSRPDDSRLGPKDGSNAFTGRYFTYDDPLGRDRNNDSNIDQLRINFWRYYPANSPQPLVYFDASRDIRDLEHAALTEETGQPVFAIKKLKSGATPNNLIDLRLANEGKFQVLHAGVDGDWGAVGPASWIDPTITDLAGTTIASANPDLVYYPDGPFTLEAADTITNFAENTTLEASQP